MKILYRMEHLILFAEILRGIILEDTCRISLFQRAFAASGKLPFFTSGHAVIAAVTRISPAIMQSPYYRLTGILKKVKQHRDINVISVKIMQMNDIRIVLFDLLNKLLRSTF